MLMTVVQSHCIWIVSQVNSCLSMYTPWCFSFSIFSFLSDFFVPLSFWYILFLWFSLSHCARMLVLNASFPHSSEFLMILLFFHTKWVSSAIAKYSDPIHSETTQRHCESTRSWEHPRRCGHRIAFLLLFVFFSLCKRGKFTSDTNSQAYHP